MLPMNGNEFLKKLKSLSRETHVPVRFESGPGKGSHGRVFYGGRFTTLKDRKKEIGIGLLRKMLSDLGIDKL
jgi:mRNA interferase HicA